MSSALLEFNEYLKENEPDIMGLVETKLGEELEVLDCGEGKYMIRGRNREDKQGGEVMVLVKKELAVDNVIYALYCCCSVIG